MVVLSDRADFDSAEGIEEFLSPPVEAGIHVAEGDLCGTSPVELRTINCA